MIITCENCSSRFRLDDSRIGPQGSKVRCSKCSHAFMVHREEEPEPVALQGDEVAALAEGVAKRSPSMPPPAPGDFQQITRDIPVDGAPMAPQIPPVPQPVPHMGTPTVPVASGESYPPPEAGIHSQATRRANVGAAREEIAAMLAERDAAALNQDNDLVTRKISLKGARANIQAELAAQRGGTSGDMVTREISTTDARAAIQAALAEAKGDGGGRPPDQVTREISTKEARAAIQAALKGGGDFSEQTAVNHQSLPSEFVSPAADEFAQQLFSDVEASDSQPGAQPLATFAEPSASGVMADVAVKGRSTIPGAALAVVLTLGVAAGGIYQWVLRPLEAQAAVEMPKSSAIAVRSARLIDYPAVSGKGRFVVTGVVENTSAEPLVDQYVVAALKSASGETLLQAKAPLALSLDEGEVSTISFAALDGRFQAKVAAGGANRLDPKAEATYVVLFPNNLPNGDKLGLSLTLEQGLPIAAPVPEPEPEPVPEVVEPEPTVKKKKRGRRGKKRRGKRRRNKNGG